MNADSVPLYFGPDRESLFGWLHRPPDGQLADVGLVICQPFGYEVICAHRSIRAFADAIAASGIATLRFDYSSTGDSAGVAADGDQIAQWCGDIVAAIRALKQHAGVTRVCLLGMRLGALLAGLVAAEHEVEALVAVTPVVSGRRYLRELRTYQAAAGAAGATGRTEGGIEVTGFSLSPATVERLAAIDLTTMALNPLRVLILDRDDLATASAWQDSLAQRGVNVDYRRLPGFTEMMSTPHASQIPQRMLAATVEWVGTLLGPRLPDASAEHSAPRAMPPPASLLTGAQGIHLQESACFIDGDRAIFGIVTTAAGERESDGAVPKHGAVMLNCGATYHIGPNRMHVDLARQWAERGYVVLRLDLAGLGDSATRSGRPENEVYPPDAVLDVGRAVDYLRRVHGVTNVTLLGLCSGAYHALRAAVAGVPATTLLMINPLTFHWEPGSTLSDLQISEVVRNPGVYSERVLDFSAWRRLLRGRVNLRRIATIYARRGALALESALRDLGRLFHIHLPNDLGRDLELLADRGVKIVFIFARGDGGEELLRLQGGVTVKRLGDRCRVYVIDGADHIFSQSGQRKELVRLLDSELPA